MTKKLVKYIFLRCKAYSYEENSKIILKGLKKNLSQWADSIL